MSAHTGNFHIFFFSLAGIMNNNHFQNTDSWSGYLQYILITSA